jgi:integrase
MSETTFTAMVKALTLLASSLAAKSHKGSLKTHDRKLAERKLAEFIQKIENKEQEKPDVVFQDFADRWLETIKPDLKASSYERRLSSVNQLKPIFKDRKLREITHEHLQDWKITRSTVSSRTFNLDRETLAIIFQYAVKSGIMRKNPIDKDTLPKRKEKKAIVTPPTREQFAEFLAVMRTSRGAGNAVPFVEFLAYTGMRLEEASQVLWRDVDFNKGLILVTGGKVGTKNHQQRSIPLFEPARAVLEKLKDGKEMAPTSRVFLVKSARSSMKTASDAIGLPDGQGFTHHDMRHFFCSNALEQNIPDHVIASWLGHKDGGILVRKTYGHLRQSHATEMAKLMTFKG